MIIYLVVNWRYKFIFSQLFKDTDTFFVVVAVENSVIRIIVWLEIISLFILKMHSLFSLFVMFCSFSMIYLDTNLSLIFLFDTQHILLI